MEFPVKPWWSGVTSPPETGLAGGLTGFSHTGCCQLKLASQLALLPGAPPLPPPGLALAGEGACWLPHLLVLGSAAVSRPVQNTTEGGLMRGGGRDKCEKVMQAGALGWGVWKASLGSGCCSGVDVSWDQLGRVMPLKRSEGLDL